MQDSSKQLIMTLYHIDSQRIDAQVLLKDSTIWASQKTIADIFGVNVSAISKHLKNIFDEGELDKSGYSQNGNNHSARRDCRQNIK